MRRFWPLALLLLPATAAIRHVEPQPLLRPCPSPVAAADPGTNPVEEQAIPTQAAAPEEPVFVYPMELVERPPAVDHRQEWRQSSCTRGLVWLGHHQNEDGSWGDGPVWTEGRVIDRVGVTSLALLSYLEAGYSHLSRDEYDGVSFGPRFRKAAQWLLDQQLEDGTFRAIREPGFEQALATAALSEWHGMTSTSTAKEPVQRALDALCRMQGEDGGWGGPAATAWAIFGVRSAEFNEIPLPSDLKDRALRYVDSVPHESYTWNHLQLASRKGLDPQPLMSLVASPPDPEDFAAWYHAIGSVRAYDGPGGPHDKFFVPLVKDAILPRQQADGSWSGGTISHAVVRSSLAMLTLQALWSRYPSGS